jgi:hypothetical protein
MNANRWTSMPVIDEGLSATGPSMPTDLQLTSSASSWSTCFASTPYYVRPDALRHFAAWLG